MKILLAEDDLRLGRAVKRVFEEEGYDVLVATDGKQAYDAARNGVGADVIILDITLPELNGFDVCRQLRQGGVQTPVLMMTGRAEVEDKVQGLDAGADDYMVKPFAVAELLARVRALSRRGARTTTQNQLRAGDLTLDIARHSAIRGEREIELTVKEFQLLELLLRHEGQVLSRSQILDHVWQYDREFASNVVDIYIHYLRNKIDKGFQTPLIHTVRGVGYSLRAA